MNVVAVQYDIVWENPDRNYELVSELVESAPPEPGDLLILPEMFSTGFSMNTQATLEPGRETDQSAEFMRSLARKFDCDIIGGVVWPDENSQDQPGNQAVWIQRDGGYLGAYQKICPFSMVGEDQVHKAGHEVPVFNWNGIQVAMLVCYDLRFPELFREALAKGAEMFVVIANWPERRESHWTRLIECRAIENLAYVVGVNRTGADPNFTYPGRTRMVDPLGDVLADGGAEVSLVRTRIEIEKVRDWRKNFPAYQDSLNLSSR